ncbi:MAG TPA: GNAT family N-acetyltransferase [Jiangellaceae bacterium]|nr:GNAT family N-acetyltransferase [Jiangellaceae bacterium]
MRRQREDGYEVSDDPARLDLDTIHGFLRTAYWSPGVTRQTVEASVAGSLPMGLYAPDGTQAGYARAVTDRATFGYLADVFVLPEHRGRGLSRFLVRALLEHPDLTTLRRWMLATADAHGIYEALGFAPLDDPDTWMVRGPRPQVSGDRPA